MVDARDAWMKHGDNKVSRSHLELAKMFDELGVRYEVERVTDDGYFSMDITKLKIHQRSEAFT